MGSLGLKGGEGSCPLQVAHASCSQVVSPLPPPSVSLALSLQPPAKEAKPAEQLSKNLAVQEAWVRVEGAPQQGVHTQAPKSPVFNPCLQGGGCPCHTGP